MIYKTSCPECGSKALEVTYGRFIAKGMSLSENGVDFRGAEEVTLDEEEPVEVTCRTCGAEFELNDLRK